MLAALLQLAVFIVAVSLVTGLVFASVNQGRLAVRAGLAWGIPFALGMIALATPAVVMVALARAFDWAPWADRQTRQLLVLVMMVAAVPLVYRLVPALSALSRRIRG